MHEYSSVKEALKDLVDINEGLVHDQNGKLASARSVQELNLGVIYQICDLLGCDDLYVNEQNKKATYDGMDRKKKDDIIKNGVIQIDAESIVFAKGAFKACDDQQNFDSSANQE